MREDSMNGRYMTGAVGGGVLAGLGITAMMISGEKKSGMPSELIELQRASARKLGLHASESGTLPTGTEQAVAQGGHLLLSGIAGAAYAAVSDETTNPVLGGVLFGLAFYGVAHWLTGPALGVKTPEWTQGGKTIGMHAVNHVGFGLMTALAARIAARN
jgi:hypothetical protein